MNGIEQSLASILARSWWLLLLRGLVAIAFGVLTWFQPGISLAVLVWLFGAYSMADGVLGTWTALAGLASVVFGVFLMVQPRACALAVLWLIASFATVSGFLLVVLAFKARRFAGMFARS